MKQGKGQQKGQGGFRMIPVMIEAFDGFTNPVAGLGAASPLTSSGSFERSGLEFDFSRLMSAYEEDSVAKRIIDLVSEEMTRAYSMYSPFFEALYHEFRQQSRKHPDQPVNPYKAERLNHILRPLKEMMQGEEYAEMLELIHTEGEESMSYSDAMILMTQYKCSLAKFHRDWR